MGDIFKSGSIFGKLLDPAGIFIKDSPSGGGSGGGAGNAQGGGGSGAAAGSASPGGVAPGTSPDEFQRQQTAYYQQMFAGLGQGQPGGELPQGVQDNINKQASLIS